MSGTHDSASGHAPAPKASDYLLPKGSPLAGAWKIAAGIGVLGMGASAFGYTQNQERFAFSYLFAFLSFLTVGLGALFFVLIQYITKAGWSVTVRRTAEFFMSGLWVLAILVVPLVFTMRPLFKTWIERPNVEQLEERVHAAAAARPHAPLEGNDTRARVAELRAERQERVESAIELEEARVLEEKAPYLNETFFRIRTVFYALVWIALGWRYFTWSTEQDRAKRVANTAAAQKFAPAALMLFALTITFAAFDWIMSLDPFWYSTIFGVYVFATTCVVNMAVLILVTMMLRKTSGALRDAITIEHYHDMGKLLFGWLVFWAYVSFAQFFLIWYANIPEEITFYHRRWDADSGSWRIVSIAIVVVHFAVPFWLLMSRNIKRRLPPLAFGAAMLILMHVVEMYWLVMPNLGPFSPHWLDVTCLLGVGGVYLAVVLYAMAGNPLIPVGDPRLTRALKFENA